MSLQLRSFAFVFSSLFALACGGEDPKAQDKCEALVTSYCDRVVSCAENSGVLDASYTTDELRNDCEQSLHADAQCEDAVKVSSKYDSCVRDAKALSCDDVAGALSSSTEVPLPDSCHGAILHPEE